MYLTNNKIIFQIIINIYEIIFLILKLFIFHSKKITISRLVLLLDPDLFSFQMIHLFFILESVEDTIFFEKLD